MLRLNYAQKLFAYLLLIIYAVIIIFPFFVMIIDSFKTMADLYLRPFSLPISWIYQNYITAWQTANIGTGYINSIIIASSSVLIVVILSSMLAYAISRFKFPFYRQLFIYSLLGLALPANLAVIPIYILMNKFHLINSLIGLIIIYSATGISFSTFLFKNFIDAVPLEIEESAKIDGASDLRIYGSIVLPLIRPAISVVAIVNFVGIWNDFFYPLIFINSQSKFTITLSVLTMFQGEYTTSWSLLFAGLSLSIIPMIIIFVSFSKQFIAGITQGAIK
jgi:raffinose/stachyose/melibiose transport system permease protein